jgi:ankyrin repeat protein
MPDEEHMNECLHAVDEEGWSPLHLAARYGKVECMILLLVNAPGNINTQKDYGWTPLLLALFAGHSNVTSFLIWKGADIEIMNDEGVDGRIQALHTCPQCIPLIVRSSLKSF